MSAPKLARRGFVTFFDEEDYNRNPYTVYRLTEEGLSWLFDHQGFLVLRRSEQSSAPQTVETADDDEVPF